ncbi:MAG: hypothetical protein Q8J65_08970 [Nitrosomonadales bacterium]|nr:hypothetical protein [Nitrosomonadales bacterium]
MKLLFILPMLFLSACAALMNAEGAAQPVKRIDVKEKIFITTCSGVVEDWGSCNSKAQKTCENGYEIMKKEENPPTAYRELTFKCK